MSLDDKIDSTKDKVSGKAKEVEGKVTNDKAREAEGKGQGILGKAKDKLSCRPPPNFGQNKNATLFSTTSIILTPSYRAEHPPVPTPETHTRIYYELIMISPPPDHMQKKQ